MSYEKDIFSGLVTSGSLSTALALKQDALIAKDEGASLTSGGSTAFNTINIVGSNISASLTTGILTITTTAPAAAGYPPGHIFGLTMSNAADANNDITIAAGSARSDDDTANMDLAASITKQLDASWAVGDNAGGINTGSEANSTWYEVHLIKRTDTGVVDVMFTTTANRATLPTNYTVKRRIGWIRNNGSGNILAFTQVDDRFLLTTQVNDVSQTLTTTAQQKTLTAPPSTVVRFRASLTNSGAVAGQISVVFSEVAEGNVTPASSTGISSLQTLTDSGSNAQTSAGHFELLLDSSSQIEVDCSGTDTDATYDISTFGWSDNRGRSS